MNNAFGLGVVVFGAFVASAIRDGLNTASSRPMKKPDTVAPKQDTSPEDGAKTAKEIYDSYVKAGFNEVQAFELLKLVLSK